MKNAFFALVLLAVFVKMSQAAVDAKSIYDQCKDNKTLCVGMKMNQECSCDCEVMATIQTNLDKTTFKFTLMGMNSKPDTYVALGISEDGKSMKDVLIVMCSNDNSKSVGLYWASSTSNPIPLLGGPTYFKQSSNQYVSGNILCEFELNSKFVSEKEISFNLNEKKYAVLLAQGTYKGNTPQQHDNRNRMDPASLTSFLGNPTTCVDKSLDKSSDKPSQNSSTNLATSYLVVLSLLGFITYG